MNEPADAFDLVLQRQIDIPPAAMWRCWTDPETLMRWFCPVPWKTTECEIDPRPGGRFRTLMQGPNGESFDGVGCYLEVVPNERLVWMSALRPGFGPAPVSTTVPIFTASITMAPQAGGTLYSARARHTDAAGCEAHAKMGFHEGWGVALDPLVAAAKAR